MEGFEIDFLPVGEESRSGDAICIRCGSAERGYTINVVDGGFKATTAKIIEHLDQNYGRPSRIDNVVLTHPHADHAAGLVGILEAYEVGALWMHRPWLHSEEVIHNFHGNWTVHGLSAHFREEFATLVELEAIANRKNIPIYEPFQGAQIGEFVVLAPSRARYASLVPEFDKAPESFGDSALGWLAQIVRKAVTYIAETWTGETLSESPEPTDPVNESSVVQAALIDGELIVLTSDAGPAALTEAADYLGMPGSLRPRFFQVPHHGSRRNVTPTTLNRWLGMPLPNEDTKRGVAYCSAAEDDGDHPRKKVLNAFIRRGYPVHSTKGTARCSRHNAPSRPGWGPSDPELFSWEVEE